MSSVWINEKIPAKALSELQLARDLSQKTGDDYSLAYCYNNIGAVYQNIHEDDKAISFYNMALALRDDLGDQAGLATTLDNLGKMYIRLKRFDQALNYFYQALQINQQLGDKRSTAITLNSIGELLLQKKDFPAAIDYLNRGKILAEELSLRQEARVMNGNLLMCYAAMHKFDSAHVFLYQYVQALDSSWYSANPIEAEVNPNIAKLEKDKQIRNYFIFGLVILLVGFSAWGLSRYTFKKSMGMK